MQGIVLLKLATETTFKVAERNKALPALIWDNDRYIYSLHDIVKIRMHTP